MERIGGYLKRLHPDHERIARAAVWLLLITIVAKLATAGREVAIAWRFGRGPEADAFNLATMLAMWLPLTIYSVMTVVLVPLLVRLRRGPLDQRRQFLREITGVAIVAGLLLAAATWLLAPWLVRLFAAGLPQETGELAEVMLRSFALLPLLLMLIAVHASSLQAVEDHRYALAEGFPPLAVVLLLVVWATGGAMALIVGTLSGFAWQAWWLARLAREPIGGPPVVLRLQAPHWANLWRGALVIGAGHFAMSFQQPIDQWFAADVGSGAIATLGYVNRIVAIGMALGATVISRATLPIFAEGIAGGDARRVRAQALGWAGSMLLVGVAGAAAAWPLAPWLVAVVFERGAFSVADTQAVAEALRWGAWQLPPYLAGLVLVSQLASEGRYNLIAVIAMLCIGAKLTCTYALVGIFGVAGIMVATAVMYSVSTFSGWIAVRSAAER